jgi:hypothetical protein
MWVDSMELASCHPSDALNFEVAIRFLESLWTIGIILINTSIPFSNSWTVYTED